MEIIVHNFQQGFIDELKILSKSDRQYDPNSRIWFVNQKYRQQVRDMAERNFRNFEMVRGG